MSYYFKNLESLVTEIEHQAAISRKRQNRLRELAVQYERRTKPGINPTTKANLEREVRNNAGIGAVRRNAAVAGGEAAAYEQVLEYLKGLEAL